MKTVNVGNMTIGGGKGLFVLAGPCVTAHWQLAKRLKQFVNA